LQKKNTLEPIAKNDIILLDINEIIEYGNSVIQGITNYYYTSIIYKSTLRRIIYIIQWSIIKTLCKKLKISANKLFIRFGWKEIYKKNMKPTGKTRIIYQYFTEKYEQSQIIKENNFVVLRDYLDATELSFAIYLQQRINPKYLAESSTILFEDFWTQYKSSWRTKFKLTKFCIICGTSENLESHHIKKIRGLRKSKADPFIKVMAQLNRKQIIVCRGCHMNIHSGKYNNISLKLLYDRRIPIIENITRTGLTTNYSKTSKNYKESSGIHGEKYMFNEQTRTVYNNIVFPSLLKMHRITKFKTPKNGYMATPEAMDKFYKLTNEYLMNYTNKSNKIDI